MTTQGNAAVILAGGSGTRLRPAVDDVPKPLAPVGGRPFIEYVLDQLVDAGIDRVVLCTGYMTEKVEAAIGTSYRGLEVVYSVERSPLGTGGALCLALPHLHQEHVIVLNGDSFVETDLRSFVDWSDRQPSAASLVTVRVSDMSRYGVVRTDDAGCVLAFEEKSEVAAGTPGWINAGVYRMPTGLLSRVAADRPCSLEHEILPMMVKAGLAAYQSETEFIDIGTPDSYRLAESFFQRLEAQQ